MAERVGDAFAERGTEFCGLGRMPGRAQTLLGPDLAPHRGEGVGEGRVPLAIPGRGRDAQACAVAQSGGEQGDDREQPEQAGRGAGDGLVRPLPLGLHAEVVAHLSEGDLQPPPRSEEHTSELQSRQYLVCRLLLEKKKIINPYSTPATLQITSSIFILSTI